jgi:sodium-dependent dicarboxylate transporter 2/3/5
MMTRSHPGRAMMLAARAPLAAAGAVLSIEILGSDLSTAARLALMVFALALVGWVLTPLPDTLVAVLAAACMLGVAGMPEVAALRSTGELLSLMAAGFLLAGALRRSGWSEVMVGAIVSRASSVRMLFHGFAAAMLALAFVIPSTAARAALALPLVAAIAGGPVADPRLRKALALLAATTILLSAFASLLGAGAHIVAAEILSGLSGETIGFAAWAALGVPFAVASVFLSAEIILRMFLAPAERVAPAPARENRGTGVARSTAVLWIIGGVIVGWLAAPWHGLDETIVALFGVAALTLPAVGALAPRDAIADVEWDLLLFMVATALLAHGLVGSGLAGGLVERALVAARTEAVGGLVLLAAIAAVGLSLHLIVHSRTARVAILLPPALLLGAGASLAPLPVMLATVAATGVCQTLMISAKPVMLLARIDGCPTYSRGDLLRLSAVLMPLHLALIVLFGGVIWPAMGIGLVVSRP